ncbi:MAG: NACHT domain-containing protein, partial [Microcystis sp. M53600_WE12]|nr:NACHT domain-containing protein [Microcystis sp. M53600_WE12]
LLLTFLCLVYDENQSFPTNRSRLYQDALRILLEKWSAEKRLPNRGLVYENLSIEQEEILLSEIAYQNFVADKLFLEKREVVKQIKDHLKQNLNAPQHLDGEKVLKTIEIEQGILVERARDVYSFSHLTLQEYLTAQYIYDNDLIEETVKNHITETRWQEVFLLVAGLMRGKADKLLLAMEKEAHNYLTTPLGQKLVPILQWADEMTKDSVDSPIKPVGRRALAYWLVIFYTCIIYSYNVIHIPNVTAIIHSIVIAYAYAPEIAYLITKMSFTPKLIDEFVQLVNLFAQDRIVSKVNFSQLSADLEAFKQIIPDDKATEKERQEFVDQLFKMWNTAFNLTPKLLNLSIQEICKIDRHYFYINRLILKCQKVAVNISPTVWQEIEDRMLRIP